MELDKRIKEGKRPLTCFDLKEAEQFIGKDGYFAHEMEAFENLDRCYFSRLLGFDTCNKSIPFAVANASRDYEFFIPAEWVKESEKKFRAFTLAEWALLIKIGAEILAFGIEIPGVAVSVGMLPVLHLGIVNAKDHALLAAGIREIADDIPPVGRVHHVVA